MSFLRKVLSKLGIDGAIAFTLLTRILQAFGSIGSLFFIARFLNADEQGYYYTFVSIIAIQIFFELGLSGIITQYTAHEFAHLTIETNGVSGPLYNRSRLSSLLRFCVKWFGLVSILLFFLLSAAGYCFFNWFKSTSQNINWQLPWLLLCLATSANLFIDPLLAFFDGIGMVKDMAKLRLIQKITFILVLFILFACGFKLYSGAVASLVAILINYFQVIFTKRYKILVYIWHERKEWVVDYFKEIFPYQWKIALSWVSGYFIFQLFNPVIFATDGPAAAGQMGITLAALNGVLSLSISWINTKVPVLSGLIAIRDYPKLDKLFGSTIKKSNIVCVICLIVFIATVQIFRLMHIRIGNRFLPLIPMVMMAVSTFLSQYISGLATYLRCHKKEPLLIQSVVMSILFTISTLYLGHYYGVYGITIGYTTLGMIVAFPWTLWIFYSKKKKWHS